MRDVQYLRAQANLCLDMAALISDGTEANKLRQQAAHYRAEASALEARERPLRGSGDDDEKNRARRATAAKQIKEP